MRKDPGIKIRGQAALIIDITALTIIPRGGAAVIGRRADNFMIGKDAGDMFFPQCLFGDHGTRAIRPDDGTTAHGLQRSVFSHTIADDRRSIGIALQSLKCTGRPHSPGQACPAAQIFVEMLPVHHRDIPVVNGHIHQPITGGDDARTAHFGNKLPFIDIKIFHQTRGNCTATGFDPTCLVQQQNRASSPRPIIRSSRATRAAADHHNIINV